MCGGRRGEKGEAEGEGGERYSSGPPSSPLLLPPALRLRLARRLCDLAEALPGARRPPLRGLLVPLQAATAAEGPTNEVAAVPAPGVRRRGAAAVVNAVTPA